MSWGERADVIICKQAGLWRPPWKDEFEQNVKQVRVSIKISGEEVSAEEEDFI